MSQFSFSKLITIALTACCMLLAVGAKAHALVKPVDIRMNSRGEVSLNGKVFTRKEIIEGFPALSRYLGFSGNEPQRQADLALFYKFNAHKVPFRKAAAPVTTSMPDPAEVPTEVERRKAADLALSYLEQCLVARRGLWNQSGYVGRTVTYATAGLAFLSSGSTPTKGPYRKAILRCRDHVNQNVGRVLGGLQTGGLEQSTWSYAFSLLFMVELYKKQGSTYNKAIIERIVKKLEARQVNGSWCHGAKGPNPLGYSEFNGIGTVCLMGLGMARQVGAKVNNGVIMKAIKYIEQSTNLRNGVVGYSNHYAHRFLGEPGRTAAATMAFRLSGDGRNKRLPVMERYMARGLPYIENGHGSPLYHIMMTAMSSTARGKKTWDVYWRTWGATLLARQQKNGSFAMVPGSKAAGDTGDRNQAVHALVLLLPENHLSFFSHSTMTETEARAKLKEAGGSLSAGKLVLAEQLFSAVADAGHETPASLALKELKKIEKELSARLAGVTAKKGDAYPEALQGFVGTYAGTSVGQQAEALLDAAKKSDEYHEYFSSRREAAAQATWNECKELEEKKQWQNAIRSFDAAAKRYAGSPLAEKFSDAAERLRKDPKVSAEVKAGQKLRLAQMLLDNGYRELARENLRKLRAAYPGTRAAAAAADLMAK